MLSRHKIRMIIQRRFTGHSRPRSDGKPCWPDRRTSRDKVMRRGAMNEDRGCGSPLALGLLNLPRTSERRLRKLNYRGGMALGGGWLGGCRRDRKRGLRLRAINRFHGAYFLMDKKRGVAVGPKGRRQRESFLARG